MSPLIKATHLLMLNSMLIVSSAAQSVELKPQVREPGVRASASDEANGEVAVLSLSERHALWLLDHLLEEAKSCDDETFRIITLAQLADLLWKYDEPGARRQFEKALGFIDEIKAEPPGNASDPPLPIEYGQQYRCASRCLNSLPTMTPSGPESWEVKQVSSSRLFLPMKPSRQILERRQMQLTQFRMAQLQRRQAALDSTRSLFLIVVLTVQLSFRTLLAQAEVARTHEERDGLYTRATLQALAENDFDQALSIIRKIKSESSRASLEAMTRKRAATAALNKQDFVAAERYARGSPALCNAQLSSIRYCWHSKRETISHALQKP